MYVRLTFSELPLLSSYLVSMWTKNLGKNEHYRVEKIAIMINRRLCSPIIHTRVSYKGGGGGALGFPPPPKKN